MISPLKNILTKCGLLLAVMMLASVSFARVTVDVVVPADVLENYKQLLNGREPESIRDFSGPTSNRDTVEPILLQQALQRAGSRFKVNWVPVDNYGQMLAMITSGEAVAVGTAAWKSDLTNRQEHVYITSALVARGEFEAGFYVLPSNKKALSANTREKIKELSAVTSSLWTPDWTTLTSLKLKKLEDIGWPDMIHRVGSGEVDFFLQPFRDSDGMKITLSDAGKTYEFVPIPDIKIGFNGSRHLAVSRAHPYGAEFNAALHLGLMRLKKADVVTKAYEQSGFYNSRVRDWDLVKTQAGIFD